jgi:membrane dipeptidase
MVLTSAALGATFGSHAAQHPSRGRLIINALGGIENPNLELQRPQSSNPVDTATPDVDERALHDAHAAGLTAVNVTLGYVGGPGDPFDYTLQTIRVWDDIVRRHAPDLAKVLRAADIVQAQRDGRIGVIYGFQNAAMMGNDAGRAHVFAGLGVRAIQLTYNPANQLGDGCMASENRGLTAFGREVVAQLNESRVMVDLSHSGEHTCLDAARVSRAPISINHTGCRALANLPRNKTDEELRLVAARGGFIGIFFMPFLNVDGHPHAEDVVAHVEHAVKVCGEDHVGIGTDGDVTAIDDLAAYRAHLAREVANRRQAGLGAAGETAETYPFIVDLRGPGQFDRLAELLRRRGHSEARVEKILGGNFLRFAREIWGS